MRDCFAEAVQAARLLPGSETNQHGSPAKEERSEVQRLDFFGRPNHPPAVKCVRGVLAQEESEAEMVEVEVRDVATAQRIGFLGSPTIRVDGQDVESAARTERAFGLSCRTYIDGGRRAGVPPLEWIRAAVREARRK